MTLRKILAKGFHLGEVRRERATEALEVTIPTFTLLTSENKEIL